MTTNTNTTPERSPEEHSSTINEKAHILIKAVDTLMSDAEPPQDPDKARLDDLKLLGNDLLGLAEAEEPSPKEKKSSTGKRGKEIKNAPLYVIIRASPKKEIDDLGRLRA
ncbi:hypothetical protein [Citreimonas salinaria]|uniref:Uncharacterized protein n=1 Tax=Citreimonas salinaria TaxID=321339 RepID=A0A1H3NII0_9RHOB|nr:hypothetical protein [Citreimonas salinaria]SDY88245.1 hypothetical protein SAMN05444340_12422 [Citreimonas salinaria]